MEDLATRRRRQNLAAPRTDVRAVTPSIRSFAQALDRQRRTVERGPVLRGGRIADALLAAVPKRTLVLALGAGFAAGAAGPVNAGALRGRADAVLDPALGAAEDPAAALRAHLELEGD